MGGTAMMHALVTGGGGFLGLYLVEQLAARGETVRVLCRGRYPRLDELGIECISGDIRDPESFKVRRGKVGGYREYLSVRDQEYAADALMELDRRFGYSP